MKPRFLYILTALLLLALKAEAQELSDMYTPVRALGMGNAFTSVANDESAVWTNPAGIARIRKARSRKGFHFLTFPNVVVGMNSEGQSFYTEFQKQQKAAADAALGDDEAVSKSIEETVGSLNLGDKPFWASTSMNPIALFEAGKGSPMAFGLFSTAKMKAYVDAGSTETARIESNFDAGANLVYGWTNRSNRLNFGVQLRPTYRYSFDDNVAVSTLVDKDAMKTLIENESNATQGMGVDIGGIWTLADFWFPSIAFSVLNVPTGCKENYLNVFDEKRHTTCGTVFSGDIKNDEALSLVDPTDIRVGLSIVPRLSRKTSLRFSIDLHHLAYDDGENFYGLPGIEPLKQLHAGMELFFGNPLEHSPLSFRAGLNQGFVTGGFSLNLGYFALSVASYGQDISSTTTPREDRRTLVSISSIF